MPKVVRTFEDSIKQKFKLRPFEFLATYYGIILTPEDWHDVAWMAIDVESVSICELKYPTIDYDISIYRLRVSGEVPPYLMLCYFCYFDCDMNRQ